MNRDAVGLALGELKQQREDLGEAIDVVERLEPTTCSAVSLAELYAQAGRLDDVIEITEGVKNEDDASALLCFFRGKAFREQGFHDAAHEALKEALRARSRAAEIRHLALAARSAKARWRIRMLALQRPDRCSPVVETCPPDRRDGGRLSDRLLTEASKIGRRQTGRGVPTSMFEDPAARRAVAGVGPHVEREGLAAGEAVHHA
jgi:tetratricopeptide (TPR) repeat protein